MRLFLSDFMRIYVSNYLLLVMWSLGNRTVTSRTTRVKVLVNGKQNQDTL